MTESAKVAYVKAQGQTRKHHCHWPGCDKNVPPAMWGCRAHWFTIPVALRERIWATYRPGQEINGTPSAKYIEAANAVQQWIKERFGSDGRNVTEPHGDDPYAATRRAIVRAAAASLGSLDEEKQR